VNCAGVNAAYDVFLFSDEISKIFGDFSTDCQNLTWNPGINVIKLFSP